MSAGQRRVSPLISGDQGGFSEATKAESCDPLFLRIFASPFSYDKPGLASRPGHAVQAARYPEHLGS